MFTFLQKNNFTRMFIAGVTFLILFGGVLLAPAGLISAQEEPVTGTLPGDETVDGTLPGDETVDGTLPGTDADSDGKLKNPIGGTVGSIPELVETVLSIVIAIGVPIAAIAIIYSGFLFVSAQGNTTKLADAKKALLYSIVGAAIILGAYILANAIGGTIEALRAT